MINCITWGNGKSLKSGTLSQMTSLNLLLCVFCCRNCVLSLLAADILDWCQLLFVIMVVFRIKSFTWFLHSPFCLILILWHISVLCCLPIIHCYCYILYLGQDTLKKRHMKLSHGHCFIVCLLICVLSIT